MIVIFPLLQSPAEAAAETAFEVDEKAPLTVLTANEGDTIDDWRLLV